MAENLFCPYQRRVSETYKDGYFRTFVGLPEMNEEAEGMISEWVDDGDLAKILWFFREKTELPVNILELDEYIMFIIREKFLNGEEND